MLNLERLSSKGHNRCKVKVLEREDQSTHIGAHISTHHEMVD